MLPLVASVFILTSCERGLSNADTERLILPTYFEYTTSIQKQLAEELEEGGCPISDKFIEDYGIVRKQIIRAEQGLK